MTPTVEMKPLSQRKRQLVFLVSILLFIIAVPLSVFYAIGYRFDFAGDITNIKSVGGMYVRSSADDTEMFINDEQVRDMRVFQRAAYIQNLEAGMHRIHVQGTGLQTWVKELPVYAHYVTEVSSFNMPQVPQIRIVTEWSDPSTGASVIFDATATTTFAFATVTNPVVIATSSATSSLVLNPEYAYVESLLASSTEQRALLTRARADSERFVFGSQLATTTNDILVTATTSVVWREFTLFEREGEVFLRFDGEREDIPHYYCIPYESKTATQAEYGEHVYDALFTQVPNLEDMAGSRVCREEIRIDRLWQEVRWFGFYPDSAELVLMLLQDGLYAVEVDDRAWQNTQRVYPGNNLEVIQDGGRIYVKDGEYLLEVYTEIASQ